MNCSGKFFEPTVTVLLALAEFFVMTLPPPLVPVSVVVDPLPPPLPLSELLLSSLPHAAKTTASASTVSAARTARIDFLIRPAPLLVFEWQRTFRAAGACRRRES